MAWSADSPGGKLPRNTCRLTFYEEGGKLRGKRCQGVQIITEDPGFPEPTAAGRRQRERRTCALYALPVVLQDHGCAVQTALVRDKKWEGQGLRLFQLLLWRFRPFSTSPGHCVCSFVSAFSPAAASAFIRSRVFLASGMSALSGCRAMNSSNSWIASAFFPASA